MSNAPPPDSVPRPQARSVETFDELTARGLSTLEAAEQWCRDREGRFELRPVIGGYFICTVRTPWHILAVPCKSFELAIAHGCRRVDELLKRDFAHLQDPSEDHFRVPAEPEPAVYLEDPLAGLPSEGEL